MNEPEIKVKIINDVSAPQKLPDGHVRVTVTKHLDYDETGLLQLRQAMRKRLLNAKGDLLAAHAVRNALREGWFYGDKQLLKEFNDMFTEEQQRASFIAEMEQGIAGLAEQIKNMEVDVSNWSPFFDEALNCYRLKVAKAKAQAKERGKK